MSNKYLLPVYSYIYDEQFSYGSFDMRLKMQKAIYLLQEMGVPVSDYGFSWYKHGPYSQTLLDDAYMAHPVDSVADLSSLSSDNRNALSILKDMLIIPDNSKYSVKDWAECLASMHYLRRNVLPGGCKDSDIINELERRKPHLNDTDANQEALHRIKTHFA